MSETPFIATETKLPEITVRGVILGILLALVLAMSNTYLALKVGILTSASIPAAVLSMGILRLFKNSNVLENNLVQTCASAGMAVAGGIIYTLPALLLIGYWHNFNYWTSAAIALSGGVLGVMFTIPLRQLMVTDSNLPFPEGKAIAEVLKSTSSEEVRLRHLVSSGVIGGLLQFMQTGLKVVASETQCWFAAGKTLFGFGLGFSTTMIGAGYLIGFRVGLSLMLGAVISWFIGIPVLSSLQPLADVGDPNSAAINLWGDNLRFVGIGGMLLAGIWTLLLLLKPFANSLVASLKALVNKDYSKERLRVEHDMPLPMVIAIVMVMLVFTWFIFQISYEFDVKAISETLQISIISGSVLYILIFGFIFSAITGYFSGLVGVSASPGSSVVIASMLIAAFILRVALGDSNLVTNNQLLTGEAITIMLGGLITASAAIANDNMQDLKVGHLLGSTPWKQQTMLLIGAVVAALVIPLIAQLLFQVYGIGDVLPRPGMNPAKALAAPPAAAMAMIAKSVFGHELPLRLMFVGAAIISVLIIVNRFLLKQDWELAPLGVATGMYLPITSTVPLFIGALLSLLVNRLVAKQPQAHADAKRQSAILIGCGLVAGAALMDVLLAIPFFFSQDADVLRIMPDSMSWLAQVFAVIIVLFISRWFYRVAK